MEDWFGEAARSRWKQQTPGVSGSHYHAYGGTRMGDNQERNVVDAGVLTTSSNLGILGAFSDGDQWCSEPYINRASVGLRTADYLVKNWKSIAG